MFDGVSQCPESRIYAQTLAKETSAALKRSGDAGGSWSDQAQAALVMDLKQRGLLDDTLVVWGGEFGRTPMSQGGGTDPGRDHHIKGFSMFLAGGGVRGGVTHGATDELGYDAVEDVVR